MPFRVENATANLIRFWQDEVSTLSRPSTTDFKNSFFPILFHLCYICFQNAHCSYALIPNSHMRYCWDEPSKPHYLHVRVDNHPHFRRRISLDKLKSRISDGIHIEVAADGLTRVLRLERVDDNISLESTINEEVKKGGWNAVCVCMYECIWICIDGRHETFLVNPIHLSLGRQFPIWI